MGGVTIGLCACTKDKELAMAASESSGTTPSVPFVPPHNPTTPALTSALTIKQGNLFLLTEMDGNISEGKHVYGS